MLNARQPLIRVLWQVWEGGAFEEGVDRRVRHIRYEGGRIGQARRGDDNGLMWSGEAQERLPGCGVKLQRVEVGSLRHGGGQGG